MEQGQLGQTRRHSSIVRKEVVDPCLHVAGMNVFIAELAVGDAGKVGHEILDQRWPDRIDKRAVVTQDAVFAEARNETPHRIA